MFKCENCEQQIPANTSSNIFPVQTRHRHYPKRFDSKGAVIDNGGHGYETVREIRVCDSCYAELSGSAQHE